MKPNLAAWAAMIGLALMATNGQAAQAEPVPLDEGIALAIIFDTSGSMQDSVRDSDGQRAPKYIVATRALEMVLQRLEAFAKKPVLETPRKIETGLITFAGNRAMEVLPFQKFNPETMRQWLRGFKRPDGSTPLGEALQLGANLVLKSPLTQKHVLVITDGLNTSGPAPEAVLPPILKRAEKENTTVLVHFIAFDVAARLFDPIKNLGITVVSAADEKQLKEQLEFILEQKILLEK